MHVLSLFEQVDSNGTVTAVHLNESGSQQNHANLESQTSGKYLASNELVHNVG